MNKELGQKIFEYRKKSKLTQKALAENLGVSNKAVSKWENGASTPTLNELKMMATLFHINISDLVETKARKKKLIHKIAITGGPCSGKSTAMSWLQNTLPKMGYYVIFIDETPTNLILGGVSPWTMDSNVTFQKYVLKYQLAKERIFEEAAKHLDNYDKIVIVCDRGALDGKAYMTDSEFETTLQELDTNEIALRDRYDAVFHLVTAAKGASDFYNNDNPARTETAEEAIEQDEKTLKAWIGHPHLRVIDNSTDFETKMRRLIAEIVHFLGEPEAQEIERKYLIKYPDIEKLEKNPHCSKVEIVQTYLTGDSNTEIRVRQRGINGDFTYTKTVKKKVTDSKRIEIETRLTKDEYLKSLLQCDTTKRQIRKTRYCLLYKNQYFEIDIYPFWKDKAIMEIELREENQKIDFPRFIKIIKDVTGEQEYYNSELAKNI